MYSLGARKMLLVGIGPLGCIPSQLAMSNSNSNSTGRCMDRVNKLVKPFNLYLIPAMIRLNSTLLGSFFVYQNIFDTFSDMIQNPSKYGQWELMHQHFSFLPKFAEVCDCSQGSQLVTKLAVAMEGMEGNWAACHCKRFAQIETTTSSGILSIQHKQQMLLWPEGASVRLPEIAFRSVPIS